MIKVELELENSPIEQIQIQAKTAPNRTLGLFANEPEMIDEMMEMIRAEREKTYPMRVIEIE